MILTVQELRIEEISAVIHRRIGRAAGVSAVAVYGDLDHVQVDIYAARPGVARGHGDAEADRLRAELPLFGDRSPTDLLATGPGTPTGDDAGTNRAGAERGDGFKGVGGPPYT